MSLYEKATPEEKARADKFIRWIKEGVFINRHVTVFNKEKQMEIIQISEEQAEAMWSMLQGCWDNYEKCLGEWEKEGFIILSALEEAREKAKLYSSVKNHLGNFVDIVNIDEFNEVINLYEKAIEELKGRA